MAKILLRIDDKEKELLEALAKKNKRSVNSEILVAIADKIYCCVEEKDGKKRIIVEGVK